MKSRTIWTVFAIECLLLRTSVAYWDEGTTTLGVDEETLGPRISFYRWPTLRVHPIGWIPNLFKRIDWYDNTLKRQLCCITGISIDLIPLSTGILLNCRTVISAANFLEPYRDRIMDLRIWALGRKGENNTPYRYRVWRWRRLFPKSMNPEHQHGPRGGHTPRHDISIIHSWDQIYYVSWMLVNQYPTVAYLVDKDSTVKNKEHFYFCGSGYYTYWHIRENYNIMYTLLNWTMVVNCERYLPKWWGKFICVQNKIPTSGVQNGGGLFVSWRLLGLGCFEIRYNNERTLVFTDLRYYVDFIEVYANITPGEYYEYAYPEYMVGQGYVYNSAGPYIQALYVSPRYWLAPPLG